MSLFPKKSGVFLLDKSCHSAAIFETPLRHPSPAPITLYGETSNSPKLMIKRHI